MSAIPQCKFQRILIAIDESQPAQWAVGVGKRLAGQLSAQVLLVHVVEPAAVAEPEFPSAGEAATIARERGKDLFARVSMSFSPQAAPESDLRAGLPADEIASAAREWNAELIVIGSRGRGRIAQFVLGSTAETVIRESPCPVISVAHEPTHLMATPDPWPATVGVIADPYLPFTATAKPRTCDWANGGSLGASQTPESI